MTRTIKFADPIHWLLIALVIVGTLSILGRFGVSNLLVEIFVIFVMIALVDRLWHGVLGIK